LASVERRRCSNEAKTRNPLKFTGMPQTRQSIPAALRIGEEKRRRKKDSNHRTKI